MALTRMKFRTGLDAFVLLVHLTICVMRFRLFCSPIECTWLMTGRPSLVLEYVLSGSFIPRGAGVSVGGIRASFAGWTGTHPVSVATLNAFNVLVVESCGFAGRIDFLINTIFCLGLLCCPFVATTFVGLSSLFSPGTGRKVGLAVTDGDAEESTMFCELIRCTLIKPFGPLICADGTRLTIFGLGISLGSRAYGKDNRLVAIGALRRIIDWFSAFARCNGTLILDIFIVFGCWVLACDCFFSLEIKIEFCFNLGRERKSRRMKLFAMHTFQSFEVRQHSW